MRTVLRYPLIPLIVILTLIAAPGAHLGGRSVTLAESLAPAVSDDFAAPNLNTDVWTFVDPLGGSAYTLTDGTLAIHVPAGSGRDTFTMEAPRIVQPAGGDLALEVAFDSAPEAGQMQGLVAEQDWANRLVVGFTSDGVATFLTASGYVGALPDAGLHVEVGPAGVGPLALQVTRTGDEWQVAYAVGGKGWHSAGSLTQALRLEQVGAYAGTQGDWSPGFVGQIAYFRNLQADAPQVQALLPQQEDTTPPVIQNQQHLVGQTKMRVLWTTDEPATSYVEYGPDRNFAFSQGTDDLVNEHDVFITGLTPDTAYFVRIRSTDAADNSTVYEFPAPVRTEPVTMDPGPDIQVWYGDNQVYGDPWVPQIWANVLGRAVDPQGISEMSYSLNGGTATELRFGPDGFRLAHGGDFNIELHRNLLNTGANSIEITAVDRLENSSVKTVTLTYVPGAEWSPPPYTADWSTAASVTDRAYVMDGLWDIENGSLRTQDASLQSYDRAVLIGDVGWQDYDVTVPVTIHQFYGNDTGVGILMRWRGNSPQTPGQTPALGAPYGALGWYQRPAGQGVARLALLSRGNQPIGIDPQLERLQTNVPYYFRMRAQTIGSQTLYLFKVWPVDGIEPTAWDLGGYGSNHPDDTHGSIMLLAHRTDASFGQVQVAVPVSDGPEIYGVSVSTSGTTAEVTWRTTTARSSLAYGTSTAYEAGTLVSSQFAVEDHRVLIEGLTPGTTYHYQITATDAQEQSTVSQDLTFVTKSDDEVSTLVSDDFNTCNLNTNRWNWVNPRGTSSVAVRIDSGTGNAQLVISVPAGATHDPAAGNVTPRVMQLANDVNMEIEAKFDSPMTESIQLQGLRVEQDTNNYVRFDMSSTSSVTRLYAAAVVNGTTITKRTPTTIGDPGLAPVWLRIERAGDTWTMRYSTDGTNWQSFVTFPHPMVVTGAGIYAGNHGAGGIYPAHEAVVDYFFNTASPIDPEDGPRSLLTVNVVGPGTVSRDPNKEMYTCEDGAVTLTALPQSGSQFVGWSGDLAGTQNPATVPLNSDKVITATFTGAEGNSLVTSVQGQGTITRDPNKQVYDPGEQVILTATPASGWEFVRWQGAVNSTENPIAVTMDDSKSITAVFSDGEGPGPQGTLFLPIITKNH